MLNEKETIGKFICTSDKQFNGMFMHQDEQGNMQGPNEASGSRHQLVSPLMFITPSMP